MLKLKKFFSKLWLLKEKIIFGLLVIALGLRVYQIVDKLQETSTESAEGGVPDNSEYIKPETPPKLITVQPDRELVQRLKAAGVFSYRKPGPKAIQGEDEPTFMEVFLKKYDVEITYVRIREGKDPSVKITLSGGGLKRPRSSTIRLGKSGRRTTPHNVLRVKKVIEGPETCRVTLEHTTDESAKEFVGPRKQ
ncbi:hypothetical protein ACFL1X_06290 [Candidatus Hydrogenedentota bacterium]